MGASWWESWHLGWQLAEASSSLGSIHFSSGLTLPWFLPTGSY